MVVVDTSVLIAVVAGEPTRDQLVARTRDEELVAPSSVHWEVGNAFSAMFKQHRITLDAAAKAVSAYHRIPMTFADVDLIPSLVYAERLGLYAYDAYLLVCALALEAPLLTLDRRQSRAARRAGARVWEIER